MINITLLRGKCQVNVWRWQNIGNLFIVLMNLESGKSSRLEDGELLSLFLLL